MPQRKPSSRRAFLQSSAAAVTGGALVGSSLVDLAAAGGVHRQGDETVRIGLIGCGSRGSGAVKDSFVASTFENGVPVKLVAMGDAFDFRLQGAYQSITRSEQFAAMVDVPEDRRFVGLDAYKKVLACDVDMVILATPPGFRPQHFAAAVNAGKHVFMEKPVAVDAPGVRTVLEAAQLAKEKSLGVGVGLQRRHQTNYQETVKRLHDGVIGDIHTLRCYWNGGGVWTDRGREAKRPERNSEMRYQVDNWYYFTWLSGDHIVEQHIHNLDVCNWVKNAFPVWAQGMGGREVRTSKDTGEIFDHHAVEFQYEDGSRMFSFCRHIPNCWDSVSEHCQGSKGDANIGGARINVNGETPWRYRGERNAPYRQEHFDLMASIKAGTPYNEAEVGAKSSMTAIMGRMATYGGKALRWEDALNSEIRLGPEPGFTFETTPPTPFVAVPGISEVV